MPNLAPTSPAASYLHSKEFRFQPWSKIALTMKWVKSIGWLSFSIHSHQNCLFIYIYIFQNNSYINFFKSNKSKSLISLFERQKIMWQINLNSCQGPIYISRHERHPSLCTTIWIFLSNENPTTYSLQFNSMLFWSPLSLSLYSVFFRIYSIHSLFLFCT